MNILEKGFLLLFLVLVVINWIIYHKIFTVYYIGSVMKGLQREIVGSVFAAMVEMAILIGVGKLLLGYIVGVGKWLLKILIILAVVVGILILIFSIIEKIKKVKKEKSFGEQEKKELTHTITAESSESNSKQAYLGKKREKMRSLEKAGLICDIILIFILLLVTCSGDTDKATSEVSGSNSVGLYISTVKNGFLGEYTDITIGELLNSWYGIYYDETGWDGGTTDDGEIIVEFQAQAKEYYDPVCIRFIMYDDQVFKLYGYDDGTGNAYDAKEVADNLNFIYYNVRVLSIDSTDGEKMYEETVRIIEQFNEISGSAVLYGASADYEGDRSKLGEEFYEEAPIELTVTELLNYYHSDMFSYFLTGISDSTPDSTLDSMPDNTSDSITDSTSDSVPSNATDNIYGEYTYDNGYDAVMQAEVGFYSGDCNDYIWLGALSYGGRYLVEYEGVLVRIQGNIYEADDGYGNKLGCVFDEGGISVIVISAEFEEFYTLEGYYPKIEGINFDEVG